MKLFEVVRCPEMLIERKPPPGARCTPGASCTSALKSRPLTGSEAMRAWSTEVLSLSENSTSGAAPSTVISSSAPPTSSLKSARVMLFATTVTSRAVTRKPESVAVTL